MSFNNTINDSLDEESSYKGRYIIGTVVDNNDQSNLNRVKVTIPGTFDAGTESEDGSGGQPWIGPLRMSVFGQGKGFGVYGSPAIGAKLAIIFQDGDTNHGLYVAGMYVADDVNPEFSNPSIWGFTDPSGNKLIVNMAANTWTEIHASGHTQTIDGSGNVTTVVPGSVNNSVQGSMDVQVAGAINITSSGIINIRGSRVRINS